MTKREITTYFCSPGESLWRWHSAWKEVFFKGNVKNIYKAIPSEIVIYIYTLTDIYTHTERDKSQWQLQLKFQSPEWADHVSRTHKKCSLKGEFLP